MPDTYTLTIDGKSFDLQWTNPQPPTSQDIEGIVSQYRTHQSPVLAGLNAGAQVGGAVPPPSMLRYDYKTGNTVDAAGNIVSTAPTPPTSTRMGLAGSGRGSEAEQGPPEQMQIGRLIHQDTGSTQSTTAPSLGPTQPYLPKKLPSRMTVQEFQAATGPQSLREWLTSPFGMGRDMQSALTQTGGPAGEAIKTVLGAATPQNYGIAAGATLAGGVPVLGPVLQSAIGGVFAGQQAPQGLADIATGHPVSGALNLGMAALPFLAHGGEGARSVQPESLRADVGTPDGLMSNLMGDRRGAPPPEVTPPGRVGEVAGAQQPPPPAVGDLLYRHDEPYQYVGNNTVRHVPSGVEVTLTPEELGRMTREIARSPVSLDNEVGIKNADTAALRQKLGLSELPPADRQTWASALDAAIQQGLPDRALDLARETIASPRSWTVEESLGAGKKLADLSARVDDVNTRIAEAATPEAVKGMKAVKDSLLSDIDTLTQGLKQSGTPEGRQLAVRRAMFPKEFDVTSAIARATEQKGAPLTPDERAFMEQKAADVAKAEDAGGQDVIDSIKSEVNPEGKAATPKRKAQLKAQLAELMDQMRKISTGAEEGDLTSLGSGLTDAHIVIAGKVVRTLVELGYENLTEIVKFIHDGLKDSLPGITHREVRDLITRYGYDPKPLTKAQETISHIKALGQRISRLEDISEGEPGWSKPTKKPHPDIVALDEEIKSMRQQMGFAEEVKKAAKAPGLDSRTDAQRLETLKKSLTGMLDTTNKKITFLEQTGHAIEPGRLPIPLDEAARTLQDELASRRAQLRELEANAGVQKKARLEPTQVQRNVAARASIKRQIERYEARLKSIQETGQDLPREEPKLLPDEATRERQLNLADAKMRFEQAVAQMKKPHWTDQLIRVKRSLILMGVHVIGKITAAGVVFRPVTEFAEDAIGAFAGNVPGLTKVFKNAPAEGHFGWRNMADAKVAAWKQFFSRQMLKDVQAKLPLGEMLKAAAERRPAEVSGMSHVDQELYAATGKMPEYHERPALIDVPGMSHSAIKEPIRGAVYEKAKVKATAYQKSKGADLAAPETQADIVDRAAIAGARAILQQENTVTTAWNHVMGDLTRTAENAAGMGTRIAARGLKFAGKNEVPIMKVPTNLIAEGQLLGTGGANAALVSLVRKLQKVPLTPEEADLVARAIKKQGLGAGLFVLGMYGSKQIQGFYTKEEKPDAGKHPMDITIGKKTVPGWSTHAAAFYLLNAGATYQRTIDQGKGRMEAVYRTMRGAAEEHPFSWNINNYANAMENSKGAEKFFGGEVTSWMPGFMKEAAVAQDPLEKNERSPTGFLDMLKMAVPGKREEVRTKAQAKAGVR